MYMPVNNVVDTNSSIWFGFHQFFGAIPAQKSIPMLCRQVCATGSCRQSFVDPRWQNMVHQWWSFTGKMCFLSASVVFLNRAGKCVLFRAVWCLQEGQFCGWLIDFFLFNYRFESSSHAISMSAYLREQRRELYSRSGELQGGEIVC